MSLRVYLMRHGETLGNVDQVLLGRGDSPFTDRGRQQPILVARHLRGRDLTCIYTSPMERTLRTAELVRKSLDARIPIVEEMAIAEIDAGDFTGLSFEQVKRRLPADAILGEFRYPEGESWEEVQRRSVAFLSELERRHEEGSVLLVTHAGVIASLVAKYFDEPIERYIRTRFGHDYLGLLVLEDREVIGYEKVVGTVDSWV